MADLGIKEQDLVVEEELERKTHIEKVKGALLNEFKDDGVYELCIKKDLESYIFDEDILSQLKFETSYSTTEAGRILGRNDSTIRNHFRSDMFHYIKPDRHGKYYRLDYIGIFKFHLIFLLMEKSSMAAVDILITAGITHYEPYSEHQSKRAINDTNLVPANESSASDQLALKKILDKMSDMERRLSYQEMSNTVKDVRYEVEKLEKEILVQDLIVEKHQSNIEAIKAHAKAEFIGERSIRYADEINERSYEKGLFGFMKKKDIDKAEVKKRLELADLEKKMESEIQEKSKAHQEAIQQANQRKEELKERLNLKKAELEYKNKLLLTNQEVNAQGNEQVVQVNNNQILENKVLE